jgi:ABC-type multidrug transport system fused ATPase/permease subunit
MRDVNEMDNSLAMSTHYLVFVLFNCILDCIVAMIASSPLMLVFLAFYFSQSFKIQRRYMSLYREATRLKSICSSPLIQAFSEGMQGVTTIRAFGKQDYCLQRYFKIVDQFQKNCIVTDALMRWFVLRLFMLSLMILIPSILMNIFLMRTGPGLFAMLMKYLLVVMNDINELLDTISNQENRMISYERCTYFANIPPELGYKTLEKDEELINNKGILPQNVDLTWPKSGSIVVNNLKIKYRAPLPYVIKGITLNLPHGTKVGIVGRTGAGKTTFLNTFFRNFDEYEGEIYFDGKELRTIDLKILRSNITIIPQDPYLFEDTVRTNLDALGQKSDAELINLLKEIEIWPRFEAFGGLDAMIDAGGSNLSQGEKQLLCLARAMLQRNKLILMDEATANIDTQSEQTIQRLLKERFNDCTILMIAHRLNTILHCNKVLVLDQGKVIEFGNTEDLRKQSGSKFHAMLMSYDEMQKNMA